MAQTFLSFNVIDYQVGKMKYNWRLANCFVLIIGWRQGKMTCQKVLPNISPSAYTHRAMSGSPQMGTSSFFDIQNCEQNAQTLQWSILRMG